ncbi:hypothetical protein G9A89_015254 [Geosiphon pyriformis]|nr:hypothetical protein G9A89_015254 [Geosiphon pyriformis]
MSSELPPESLQGVFEYLQDIKDLFSCLFVNRFWCKSVAPILWRNTLTIIDSKFSENVMTTLKACLPESSKSLLQWNSISCPKAQATFDYASFLQQLPFDNLVEFTCRLPVIDGSLIHYTPNVLQESERRHLLILQEILKMLFERSSNLYELTVFTSVTAPKAIREKFYNRLIDILGHEISKNNQNCTLLNIRSFNVGRRTLQKHKIQLLAALTSLCSSIEKVEFSASSIEDETIFGQLLMNQNRLKKFEFSLLHQSAPLSLIALGRFAETLSRLSLCYIDFEKLPPSAIKTIGLCIQLKELCLLDCSNLAISKLIKLSTSFQKLRIFEFKNRYIMNMIHNLICPTEFIKNILKYSASTLHTLQLDWGTRYFPEIHVLLDLIIENGGENLQNLQLSEISKDEAFAILRICTNLRKVNFTIYQELDDEFLYKLAQNIPRNLGSLFISLSYQNHWIFSNVAFKSYIDSCPKSLKHINLHRCPHISQEIKTFALLKKQIELDD